jgi:hypothetical protein
MKITASGGTDGANVVLFWPDNLPDEADALLQSDPITLVEDLCRQGKLIWFPCDGDGHYTVAIYVRSPVPEELIRHCRDEEQIPTLVVRGVGYFGGMEYMFKHDSSFPERYPGMCEPVQIPEGTYSAHVYRTELPETLYESWLLKEAGARAKRCWDLSNSITACAVASAFISLIMFFLVPWTVWFSSLAVAAILVCGAVAMSRTERYKAVARASKAFEKAYPSYVVHLA